ncbi:HK97 family phage major capsid protein [Saccharothrix ecbatanensis]|uniref:HK97 family phage major capsid protein n=1 Tax=Saccharothrix ecbatanensis TaxID=1105145 RepID=A0A7W9HLY6_9PSEU|nr:phage major capsid protein [Saccharothrix ecbatanensis]MBB5804660.1 HK97 family phage major capsid protein [Saccharothrix ecbatanensis]
MSFKDELEVALQAYDAAKEERSALVGAEVTEEVRTKVSEVETRMTELAAEVSNLSAKAEEERAIEEARAKSPLFVPRVVTNDRAKNDNDELRSLFASRGSRNFSTTAREFRAVLGSADGNYTSKTFGDAVMSNFANRATLTNAGAVIRNDQSGNKLSAVAVDTIDTAWTARGDALPDTTTGTVKELSAYLVGGIVRVDNQQIQDSASDLVGLIANKAGVTIANEVQEKLLTGTGTNEPTGVLATTGGAAVGVTAGASALTAANLYVLRGKVVNPTAWVMNSTTFAAIMSLDTNGLWAVDPTKSVTTLLGVPVIFDENMPNIGANNKSVVLGDFANGYYLRVAGGIDTQVLVERYAEYNQTGIKVVTRVDGVVTDPQLVQVIKHAAS